MTGRSKDTARAREMRRMLDELDASGLSVNEFSRQRGIQKSRLWYWRKRFREDAKVAAAPARVLPVTIQPESGAAASDLVVEVNGRRIHVLAGFDADALKSVVATLEAC